MKISILFICVLLFGIKGFSQPPLNVDENFDNNNLSWEVGSKETYDCKIENGFYTIDYHPTDDHGKYFWKDFLVDDSKDFIIEIKVRFIFGTENYGFGLVWGAEGWQNSNSVLVAPNGFYIVQHYEDGNLVKDIDWKMDNHMAKRKGEFNVIRIQKKGKFIDVLLNSNKIAKIDARAFIGNKVGFYIPKPMKIEVDYLHIYQYGDATINLVKNPINGFVKENVGKAINGVFSDRGPVISSDGKTLYFVKEGYPELKEAGTDIYYSEQMPDGQWDEAKNIGNPINNSRSNAVISMSADGNTLILMNTYKADGSSNGPGMSISHKTEDGWELPKKLVIEDFYNDSKYTSSCFSSTKTVLLIGIMRKDTYGKEDLYVCFKKDSTFSAPLNLGPMINTKGDDFSPFLAPDDRTLYFSSDGRQGYGSADIFVTRRLDDTWTNWSKPENLGLEINSDSWDAYFTVTAKGNYAYLVSDNNSLGKEDIFRIKLSESAKPNPVTLIKGKVLNAKTNAPIFAEIIYQNLNTNEEVGRALSDPKTGEYQIVLPSGVMYGFLAEKKSFYPVSNYVDATVIKEYNEINYDLLLNPIEVGESIRLNNLFFETNKSELVDLSFSELNRLVDFLNKNSTIIIEISGHTDNVGAAAYNQALSEQRAKSVVTYLISKGIDTKRLTSKGFGLSTPVASNDTDEGKALNRRVEMKILEK